MIAIAYRTEQISDFAWLVWRRTMACACCTSVESAMLMPGSTVRHHVFRSEREARRAIASAERADRAAATRLGITADRMHLAITEARTS